MPRPNAFAKRAEIREKLLKLNQDGRIFLFSAGHAAKVWIADLLREGKSITCIDLGSALDPLYLGMTRSGQPDKKAATFFFHRAGFQP